jgi:hypothetical protein
MSHLIVPHDVSADGAIVWLASIDNEAPIDGALAYGASTTVLDVPGWTEWRFGNHTIRHRLVALAGLEPRTRYALQLRAGTVGIADGAVTTLPRRLPDAADRPFTILLGSCFCRRMDDAATVGNTYFHLPSGATPDLKILCGDQVYLDSPWYSFARPHEIATLQALFAENYIATWTQDGGFRQLLEDGATYFISDDHEFWNNAPSRCAFAIDTWTQNGRDAWRDAARQLILAFQNRVTTSEFAVPPLSVFLADTRFNRDDQRLMTDDDLQKLVGWIKGLTAPGLLVVGQLVFDVQHGVMGNVLDWGLADYAQYGEIARALMGAQHSIVVLTGDVHFGRVAHCALPSGAELIEVVSSPLALVNESAAGKWAPAPQTFPSFDVPGIAKTTVTTEVSWQTAANQFLTLAFTGRGPAAVDMTVQYWPIATGGATPKGSTVFTRTLH